MPKNISNVIRFACFFLIFYSLVGLFILGENTETIGAFVVLTLNILIFWILKVKKIKVKFASLELILILSTFHCFLGKYIKFYETISWWDKFLHVYGTFCITLFVLSFIDIKHTNKLFTFIFIYSLGCCLGTSFEIFEYFLDLTLKTKSQKGLDDTMLDIIANNVGSLLAYFFYLYKNFSNTRRIS
ncbi:hypothetical protein SAMN05661008_00824 [Alkalithermobacter thermoalcaliphilus JW-YL-7 = DSM 7308]|uniref:VanZ family protein n=1 Tax=Alkalithermobacter thermoalcaliphilus JW-YL-7 = DSM 7308 TaxID=1121328 RepID=A0A150FQR2_CLOPD|nr:hypothetical protein JWYL7_1028 [[Clostridium] paradoxum JW-YL-7 = DSM 7308]SHK75849.1 hypothetical protein SAMN05661008_00824 [[Clostridium] paradoxum JW-YL-7 = DSM 7308]